MCVVIQKVPLRKGEHTENEHFISLLSPIFND